MTSMSSTRSRRCPVSRCMMIRNSSISGLLRPRHDSRKASVTPQCSSGESAARGSPSRRFVLDFDGSALHLQGFALALIGLVESSTC